MSESAYMTSSDILDELITRYPHLDFLKNDIASAVDMLNACWSEGGMLMTCGNGGSCADSGHIVGELMKCFKLSRPIDRKTADALKEYNGGEEIASKLEGALPAISLCAQAPLMTAFMNDSDSSLVFALQVYGYGRPGDVLMAISTSGNSRNCVAAAITAKAKKMNVIALTGKNESRLSEISDISIRVPETETFKIQELHLPVYHAICAMAEADNFR